MPSTTRVDGAAARNARLAAAANNGETKGKRKSARGKARKKKNSSEDSDGVSEDSSESEEQQESSKVRRQQQPATPTDWEASTVLSYSGRGAAARAREKIKAQRSNALPKAPPQSPKRVRGKQTKANTVSAPTRAGLRRAARSVAVSYKEAREEDFDDRTSSSASSSSSDSENEESDDEEVGATRADASRPDGPEAAEDPREGSEASAAEEIVIEKVSSDKTGTLLGYRLLPNHPRGSRDFAAYEYLVKWKLLSYAQCSWVQVPALHSWPNGKATLKRFWKKVLESVSGFGEPDPEGNWFNPDFLSVDRVFGSRFSTREPCSVNEDKEGSSLSNSGQYSSARPFAPRGEVKSEFRDDREYFVKWVGLTYDDATWELPSDIQDDAKLHAFYRHNCRPTADELNALENRDRDRNFVFYDTNTRPFPYYSRDEADAGFAEGSGAPRHVLRPYQLEGVNWLCFNYHHARQCILADEMGLGKTVQCVSFTHYLYSQLHIRGPFLIIAPLSTTPHWQREFEAWTGLNTVVYLGNAAARERIREYEWRLPEDSAAPKPKARGRRFTEDVYRFHVMITTPEIAIQDAAHLRNIVWTCMTVDEAHRLKNKESKLINELRGFNFNHCVLLTGTPIQNSTAELHTLLNFLDHKKFGTLESFNQKFGVLEKAGQVQKLHEEVRPYLLRRMKDDVEKSLLPRVETVIEVELTAIQKQYYRAVYEKNTEYLLASAGQAVSLMNIAMQLRKCCNHPFMLQGVEDALTVGLTGQEVFDKLVAVSGKLVLLDKLLAKLKAQGHRVLIFSQMVKALNILEDFLRGRGYIYERIDGGIRGNERQAAIDRFSKKDSTGFVFLLCTRAGGVGINLTAADTVVIFDSDWNPQNDIQAQARCHRIGQTRTVQVYRLVCRNTYEEEIFQRASRKLGLDRAVLHSMASGGKEDKKSLSKKEMEMLLKHGAYHVLQEDKAEAQNKEEAYRAQDIDSILASSARVVDYDQQHKETSSGVFSSFSKASFVANTDDSKVDVNDPNFWTKLGLIRKTDDSDLLGLTRPRKRTQRFGEEGDAPAASSSSSSSSYSSSSSDESATVPSGERQQGPKRWRSKERDSFLEALMTFGWGRWELLIAREKQHVQANERSRQAAASSNHSFSRRSEAELKAFACAYVAELARFASVAAGLSSGSGGKRKAASKEPAVLAQAIRADVLSVLERCAGDGDAAKPASGTSAALEEKADKAKAKRRVKSDAEPLDLLPSLPVEPSLRVPEFARELATESKQRLTQLTQLCALAHFVREKPHSNSSEPPALPPHAQPIPFYLPELAGAVAELVLLF